MPNGGIEKLKFPRAIKLRLATRQQKSEMFGLKHDLNTVKDYEKVFFTNDLNNDELMVYREVKQIHSAASKMRADSVIIDQKIYKKHDFSTLPHGPTLENVATVETPDGIAFQGHNSLLRNLYACPLMDAEGREANCVEQLDTLRQAELCGANLAVLNQIKAEKNPYNLKAISRQIRRNDDWNNSSTHILRNINELKFTCHPSLLAKLLGFKKD